MTKIENIQRAFLKRSLANWALSLSVLVTLATCATIPESYENLPKKERYGEIPNHPDASNSSIIRLKDMNGKYHCTAFVIDGRYALTAGHCVIGKGYRLSRDPIRIFNGMDQDTGIIAQAVGLNRRADMGLVRGNFENFKRAKISFNFGFWNKDPIVACGFAYGEKALTCNQFIYKRTYYFEVEGMSALYPGMSGGPVINWRTGEVIGINSSVGVGIVHVTPTVGILGAFELE